MAAKVQKISIALPKEMVAQIRYAVDSGQYASTSEVIREAVREWKGPKTREIPERVRLPKTRAELVARLNEAQASLDRGEGIPAEEVYAKMLERIDAVAAAKKRK